MPKEGAKYLGGLLAVLVVAGESSFVCFEVTNHVASSGKHALEAQLMAAREQVTAEGAQLDAARAQVSAARAQANAARAQATAARAQVKAARAQAKAKAARAHPAASSAQTVALRSRTPFALAHDALTRLGKMERQVEQAASAPHAQRCLLHVLKHEMRQRHEPDALYRRHDYTAAATGYNAVTARLALKTARCDKGIKLTISHAATPGH